MTKTIQNIVLLQETPRDAFDISMKAGKMFFNRFCIDEEAGFELSGVYNSYFDRYDIKNLCR